MENPGIQNCQLGILFLKGNRYLTDMSFTLHMWGKPIILLYLGLKGAVVGTLKRS